MCIRDRVGVGQHVFVLQIGAYRKGLTALACLLPDEPAPADQSAGQHHPAAGRQRSQTFTVSTNLQHENVMADPNRLNQVLMNILSNAVKYTPTGGHIRLERMFIST